jgi:hypothetical protein
VVTGTNSAWVKILLLCYAVVLLLFLACFPKMIKEDKVEEEEE